MYYSNGFFVRGDVYFGFFFIVIFVVEVELYDGNFFVVWNIKGSQCNCIVLDVDEWIGDWNYFFFVIILIISQEKGFGLFIYGKF